MHNLPRRQVAVEVPWRTLFKVLGAVALVWIWIQLYQLALLIVAAVLLAVALDPVVRRVQDRGVGRGAAATLVGLGLLLLLGGFVAVTWSSLSSQAGTLTHDLEEFERSFSQRVPPGFRRAFGIDGNNSLESYVRTGAVTLVRDLTQAVVVFALAFILTLYLLIEGRRTLAWLIAFVPKARRDKVNATLVESQHVVSAYVAGNLVTSLLATIFVLVVLSLLGVPAALLLAVLAGVCDFVPVLGFIVSSVPAVLLALTLSPTTAIIVACGYGVYHVLENYWIAPWVYGDKLQLSNVAVVLAFAVGAELAGVVGALIALPLAAAYPTIEGIWLREELGDATVKEHRAIEHRRAG
jgi:predicted PurR-regulated permease PerM